MQGDVGFGVHGHVAGVVFEGVEEVEAVVAEIGDLGGFVVP